MEYEVLYKYFRSLDFHFLNTWVVECVNYYKSIKPNISLEELKNEVKQQWLLANLREIKVPSLPPCLASKEKIILEGKYAVQVEEMIDSSVSCYSQFQKLKNVCCENIEATKEKKEWEIKSKRCLTFKICDGVQELEAMEYQPIKKIRNNDPELLPGFKMVIIGPVECRKGMMLLKDENIRICGGEVDTLTATNNLKSLLIQKLDLNEEDFPEEFDVIEPQNIQPPTTPNTQSCEESVATLLSQNDDIFLSLPLESENLITQQNTVSDCILIPSKNNSVVCELNSQNKLDVPNPTNRTSWSTQQNITLSSLNDLVSDNVNTVSNVVTQSTADNNLMEIDENFIEDSPPKFLDKSKTQKQTKLPSYFKNDPVCSKPLAKINCEPFVYLKEILYLNIKYPTIFTVKVIILTLTKKITIYKDEYNLRANITDGTAAIDVDFSSSVIESLLDFSPSEMISMMKMKHSNSAVNSRIKESFSRAQEKLISFNCLMKIKFFHTDQMPLVLSVEDVNRYHLEALEKRQSS